MKENKITITGKEVGVAYCFATEIGFRKYTGVGIDEFDASDPEHITYLVLAAILAYYQGNGEEPPLKSDDIIFKAKPKEIIDALTVVFQLRADWYQLPKGDDTDEEPVGDEVKND